jgi:hypothetical protein
MSTSLIPNIKIMVEYYNEAPVGIEPPKVVELKITDTAPNMKGARHIFTETRNP